MGNDFGPLPAVHKRTFAVQEARNKLASFVTDFEQQYELTDLETLGILNETTARVLKFALRAERHPNNSSSPADQE